MSEPLTSGSSADDANLVELPAFQMKVLREEESQKATVVFVFTRDADVGGELNPEDIIKEPLEDARKIFVRPKCAKSEETMNTGFDALKNGPVTMGVYQKVIRDRIKTLLRNHGFKAASQKTCDNDEILLKVWLSRDMEVMKSFAHNQSYMLPVQDGAYKGMKPEGNYYGGDAKPLNSHDKVPAYVVYDIKMADESPDLVEPFRNVDEIRLVMFHLENYLNLPELVDQKITLRHFYPASHEETVMLHERWGGLNMMLNMPSYRDDDQIRDFFGERIAFFFNWVAFFSRSLTILGIFGLCCFTLRMIPAVTVGLGITSRGRMVIKLTYSCIAILWAAAFNDTFYAHTVRRVQCWGMEKAEACSIELPSYDPELEGTSGNFFNRRLHTLAWCAFIIWFVVGVAMIQAYKMHQDQIDGTDLSATMLAIWMKLNQFVWSKISPKLVNMQNHRTDSRWYDALTFSIATVHLFITLWPGIDMNFVQKWTNMVCGDSKDAVLFKVYKGDFPANTGTTIISGAGTPSVKLNGTAWADAFFHPNPKQFGGQACLYGCYPESCNIVGADKALECQTNCLVEFQSALQQFFAFQVIFQIIFLVIPIFIIKWAIKADVDRAQQQVAEGGRDKAYTMLEVQDKRESIAPFEFKSWGGSYEEDFLEMLSAFATLVCFGCLSPIMSFVGAICFMMVYRLYAFRFLHVTGRPFPSAAGGIGMWQNIFEYTGLIAVVINVGLIVFVMLPSRDYAAEEQFLLFLALENGVLVLRQIISGIALGVEPDDVRLSRDVNMSFRRRCEMLVDLTVPESAKTDATPVFQGLELQPPK